jgi:hypothetical protein
MLELREDVLHPVYATQGQLLLSGMQRQNGSSQKRKRILGSKEKVSVGTVYCFYYRALKID